MKQNRQQIAEVTKAVESDKTCAQSFADQIQFYEGRIAYSEEALPRLIKEMETIEKGLPLWREKVRVYKLSLETHQNRMFKQIQMLSLLLKKEKIIGKIKKLE